MQTIIRMPAFSATMEAGKLLSWLVAAGDSVKKGQALAEIETDKAVATIEAPESGQVIELFVTAGDDDIPVNARLAALVCEAGQTVAAPAAAHADTPAVVRKAEAAARGSAQRVRASPAARAIARQHGVDLDQVEGTGPRGRIVRADVAGLVARSGGRPADADATQDPDSSKSAQRAGQLRLSMARALVHAKASVPHFYAEVDIGLDALNELRRELVAKTPERRAPTITAYLIRAAASALRQVPAANRYWSADAVQQRTSCHVGCAVGLPDRVVLPVLRDVDRMTVHQAGQELIRLTGLARRDALTQRDIGDASLTISNLGMHGIDRFFPIINVPEPIILGIGRARRVVSVVGDLIGIRTVVSCTASVDHRVVDGELVGRFLQAFRAFIENPQEIAS